MLLCPTGANATRPMFGPFEAVDVHPAASHRRIPGVINNELRFVVGTNNDGMVARANDLSRQCAQHSRAGFVPRIRVWAERGIRGAVVHSVSFALVTTSTVEAVIDAVAFPDARTFECVPIQNFAVHLAIRLESLPLATRTENRLMRARQARHVDKPIRNERGAG